MSEKRNEMFSPGDSYMIQVSESIKGIFELSTRIDERQKASLEKQHELEKKINQQVELLHNIDSRVKVIESKNGHAIEKVKEEIEKNIQYLREELKENKQEMDKIKECQDALSSKINESSAHIKNQKNIFRKLFDWFLQLIMILIAAYLITKLNLGGLP